VIAVIRLLLPVQEQAGAAERFRTALTALTAQPGCLRATAARSIDDPAVWVLSMSWQSVGAYRRALSAHDVKLNAVPLLHHAVDEPSAFEELLTWTPRGGWAERASDRSPAGPPPGDIRSGPDHAPR